MKDKVFISYSHADREFVSTLAHALNASGVDVWWDQWDIRPGDSIVRKIFEEGLAEARIFLVVLTKASVVSDWVREELDVATVRRIEKVTRVVPLLKEDCPLPNSLRTLLWVDFRSDFDTGVKRIVDLYHGVTERPALGEAPAYTKTPTVSIEGLSRRAATVALFIAREDAINPEGAYTGDTIAKGTGFDPENVNDAIDELKEQGMVRTIDWFGTQPYEFGQAEPTYAMFSRVKGQLDYDPDADIVTVAAAIAALKDTNGPGLAEHTRLPPHRLNRAMDYVQDYQLANVINVLGTAPYRFGYVQATRRTRDFVERYGR